VWHIYTLDQYEEDIQRIIDEANNMGLPTNVNCALVQTFISQVLGDALHAMQHIIVQNNHDFKAAPSFARCHLSHGFW
jgi:hypothetical protein